jgi:tetratricopeptide (TPR) repeat protein
VSDQVRRLETLVRRQTALWSKQPRDFTVKWELAELLLQYAQALGEHLELQRAFDVQTQTIALWRELQNESAAPDEVGGFVADALVIGGPLAVKLGDVATAASWLNEAVGLREKQLAQAKVGSEPYFGLGRALARLAAVEALVGNREQAAQLLQRAVSPLQLRVQHAPAELPAQRELKEVLERCADVALGGRFLSEHELWACAPRADELVAARAFYGAADDIARGLSARFFGGAATHLDLLAPLFKSAALEFVAGYPEAGLQKMVTGRARIELCVNSRHGDVGATVVIRLLGMVECVLEAGHVVAGLELSRWLSQLTETVLRAFERDPEACRRHAAALGFVGQAYLSLQAEQHQERDQVSIERQRRARDNTERALSLLEEMPTPHPVWRRRQALLHLQLAQIAKLQQDHGTLFRAAKQAVAALVEATGPISDATEQQRRDWQRVLLVCAEVIAASRHDDALMGQLYAARRRLLADPR